MFDYDRLALDVAQQFSSSAAKTAKADQTPENPSINQTSLETAETDDYDGENSIAHSLKDLLRHCSSSPIHMVSRYNSIDGYDDEKSNENERRMSVGSKASYNHKTVDCGASSGYGSPGIASTPSTNPAIIAYQAARNKMDQGFFDLNNSMSNVSIGYPNRVLGGTPISQSLSSIAESQHFGTPQKFAQLMSCTDEEFFNMEIEPRRNSFTAATKRNFDKENCWRKMSFSNDDDYKASLRSLFRPPEMLMKLNDNTKTLPLNASIATHQKGTKIPNTPLSLLRPPLASIPPAAPVTLKTTGPGTNRNTNKNKVSIGSVNTELTDSSPNIHQQAEDIVAEKDGFSSTEIEHFAQLLSSPKRVPPPRYVCHICYQPGHYITDCPERFNSPYDELTPYQGRKKCYGEFQCEQCKRKWTSQNSVANEAQSCIKCQIPVYPHKQLPVDKAIALGLIKTVKTNGTISQQIIPESEPSMSPSDFIGGTTTPIAASPTSPTISKLATMVM